ncbi:MAG: TlpA family protein disulfide reductase [Candidatus Methanofastidiosia archaeon]
MSFKKFSIFALLILTASGISSQRVGQPAPDFTLEDIYGNSFSLSDFRGKMVLLDFTATWCSWCRKALPELKDVHDIYEKYGLVILSIDVRESKSKVKEHAEKNEIEWIVLLDGKEEVKKLYEVSGIPTFFIIDREGFIFSKRVGYVKSEFLKKRLKKLLPNFFIISNEIDLEESRSFIEKKLEDFDFEFSEPLGRWWEEDYLIILGGPDARGVGEIVKRILTEDELEEMRKSYVGVYFLRKDVFKEGQIVVIFAGKDRKATRLAVLSYLKKVLKELV